MYNCTLYSKRKLLNIYLGMLNNNKQKLKKIMTFKNYNPPIAIYNHVIGRFTP